MNITLGIIYFAILILVIAGLSLFKVRSQWNGWGRLSDDSPKAKAGASLKTWIIVIAIALVVVAVTLLSNPR